MMTLPATRGSSLLCARPCAVDRLRSHPRAAGRSTIKIGRFILVALLVWLTALASASSAAVFVVDVTTDAMSPIGGCTGAPGDCPLRRAIELASSADEIQFDPTVFATLQTIQLVDELLIDQGFRLTGPGSERLILRGTGSDRVMRVNVTGTFDLTDVTLTNGFAGTAAGTQFGGGLLVEAGTANLNAVALVGNFVNHASGGGGNVAVTNGTVRITNSQFASGIAQGGAVGGGLFATGTGSAIVINSVFSGNESFHEGAAVANDGGYIVLTQNTLTQNTANDEGGAVYSRSGTTVVEYSTLAYNDSVSSSSNAREIHVDAGAVFLSHNILAAPTISARGLQPATICSDDSTQLNDGIRSSGYNLANRPCFLNDPNDLPQQAVGIGPLSQFDETTYYPLLSGSPAIDAGQANCAAPSTSYNMDFDQRNLERRLDGDGDGIGQCDLGAIEVQAIFVDGLETGNTMRWM